jgi:endonuclease/exonuclease/phosphatase family metal-dependent hydrolase
MSYNLWNTVRWPEREPALRNFLTTFRPDILCTQEISNETIHCIAESLKTHDHVVDTPAGWQCESNIFWNRDSFTEIEHGLEKMDMPEQDRGLFWVRLLLKDSGKTVFIATAHYSYQGNPQEMETGISPRYRQAHQTVSHLNRLVHENETAFFMGDLNDPVIPRLFFPQAGYESCFQGLNLMCPSTYPVATHSDALSDGQTLDWMFCNGQARVIAAAVPQFYHQGITPSDHYPLHAIYEINKVEAGMRIAARPEEKHQNPD